MHHLTFSVHEKFKMETVAFKLIALIFYMKAAPLYACSKKGCTSYYFVQERNMVAGHALTDFVYKNLTAEDPKACFHHCSEDCRCIAFNFGTRSNIQNCQLNEENRHTKPKSLNIATEFDYYDLVIDYPLEVSFAVFFKSFCFLFLF